MSPKATSIPCTQRSAVRVAGGTAADSLSAGLLGWHLGLTPIQLMHAEAWSSFGYRCARDLRSSHIDLLTRTFGPEPSSQGVLSPASYSPTPALRGRHR